MRWRLGNHQQQQQQQRSFYPQCDLQVLYQQQQLQLQLQNLCQQWGLEIFFPRHRQRQGTDKGSSKPAAKSVAKVQPRTRSITRIPIGALKAKLLKEPGISLRKLALIWKVFRFSFSKAIKRQTGGKSVKKSRCIHRLKTAHGEQRLAWTRRMKMFLDMSPAGR